MDAKGYKNRNLVLISAIGILFYIFGFTVFISGFMPFKTSKLRSASLQDLPEEPFDDQAKRCILKKTLQNKLHLNQYRFRRLVLVVVDAFRADFISSLTPQPFFGKMSHMPYVESLIKNKKAIPFVMTVHSPTVTLPRIKSLLTGTVSSFMDVMINFNALELEEDNLITQAHAHGHKVVFYGDDTWIKLFPDKFHRYEGTHSFFVFDYKEVDSNVTRHIGSELNKSDWRILILHYLGVDHIGHTQGPFSSLMPSKLNEMDQVIQIIHQNLKVQNNSQPDLILICGDHGMTPSGSHGGITKVELLTPLLFISTKEWVSFLSNYSRSVSQIDLAVTLSVLLGLPIPANNIGSIIPEVLHSSGMSPREILYAMYYNLFQISQVYDQVFGGDLQFCLDPIREIVARHGNWLKFYIKKNNSEINSDYLFLLNIYMQKLSEMKEKLLYISTRYNNTAMVIGSIIVWYSVFFFLCIFLSYAGNKYPSLNFFLFKNYKLAKIMVFSIICFVISIFLYIMFFQNIMPSLFVAFFLMGVFFLLPKLFEIIEDITSLLKNSQQKLLTFFFFLHVLSLCSSSFIEEEHQTWYFISTTILVISLLNCTPCFIMNCFFAYLSEEEDKQSQGACTVSDSKKRLLYSIYNRINLNSNKSDFKCIIPLILLLLCRLFRSWNQTGDKWANLPDIADWLELKQNFLFLNILVIASEIVIVFLLKKHCNILALSIIVSGMVWIYLHKCQNDLLSYLVVIFNISKKELLGPWVVYMHIMALVSIGTVSYAKHYPCKYFKSRTFETPDLMALLIAGWMLLAMIVGRVHNIPLLAGVLMQEYLLNEITWKQSKCSFSNTIYYLIMAMSSFFYQGNSNSLSTIDVFAGYTGLSSYQPVLVGFLLVCNTYSCPILWLLMAYYRIFSLYLLDIYHKSEDAMGNQIINCCMGLVMYRLIVLSTYLILLYVQRYHLFILTVFGPKLLYETAHTVLFIINFIFFIIVFNL